MNRPDTVNQKPPPIHTNSFSNTQNSYTNLVKRTSKKIQKKSFLAPPSPRIDLSPSLDSSFYGYILLFSSILGGLILISCLLSSRTWVVYYAALAALMGPIVCFFTFFNWLGLKYFRHNVG